jgi:NAD(P)-dependent dehydrogenase (short-subunit alcohol dehydrogenase family)
VGVASDIKGLAIYLASEASSFVTGQVFVEDGGFMA